MVFADESELDDMPMPVTYTRDHDWEEHTTFEIENLFGTNCGNDDVNNCYTISTTHVSSNDDTESSKLGEDVFENPLLLMIIYLRPLLLVKMMICLQMKTLWKITILLLMMILCLQSLIIIIEIVIT